MGVDHTSGDGMFLIVNGDAAEKNVWCQNINGIEIGSLYTFSVWISALSNGEETAIQFTINGNKIGDKFKGPDTRGKWIEYSITWCANVSGSIDLCILSFNYDAKEGNDFRLDDVSVVCSKSEIEVTEDLPICAGESVQLNANGNSLNYTWIPIDFLDDPNSQNPISTPPQTITYVVIGEYEAGCKIKDSVTITVNEGVSPQIKDGEVCPGGTITLVSEPQGVDYEWYDAAVGGNLMIVGDRFTTPPLFVNTTYYLVNPAECAS